MIFLGQILQKIWVEYVFSDGCLKEATRTACLFLIILAKYLANGVETALTRFQEEFGEGYTKRELG